MANKKAKITYRGLNQDVSKSKFSPEFYYDAKNIRIIATDSQSTGSVTNEKGNTLVVEIPIPVINYENLSIDYIVDEEDIFLTYKPDRTTQPRNEIESNYYISDNVYRESEEQKIIGHGLVRDNFIIFTTDNNGFDCIWKVNDKTYDISLLYMRDMGWNELYPIQCINNYENEIIDKIYWVNGRNQLSFINIHHSIDNGDLENLIDLDFDSIQMVGTFDLDQPSIIDLQQGGIHTSGVIQYAYNLYRVNGSQTSISPLTELIPLTKGEDNGGGELNEIVGTVPVIQIDNLDSDYTNLRLFAIKYTSYNQIPQVSIILDRDITSVNSITYYDNGSIIEDISLEELLFLGSDIIIPKHINTKKNIMFLANYKEKNFDVNNYGESTSIDTRAYSFANNQIAANVYNSLALNDIGTIISNEPAYPITTATINGTNFVPYKHSAININYDVYNKQFASTVVGGEGPYLKYRIVRNRVGVNNFSEDDAEKKFLKDNEIYRLGIQFYNKYGQNSLPKWIADFKNVVESNQSNLNGYYASIEITLKPLFYTWLNNSSNFLDDNGVYDESLKPVGYRLLRAERTLLDRSILCQGILNGTMAQLTGDVSYENVTSNQFDKVNNGIKIPSLMRRFDDYLNPFWHNESYFRLDRDQNHPALDGPDSAGKEIFTRTGDGRIAGTFQFNQLMQMFSPEITFNIVQNLAQSNLTVIGGLNNDYNAMWGQLRNINTKVVEDEVKLRNILSYYDEKRIVAGNIEYDEGGLNFNGYGYIGPRDGENMEFLQLYRRYTGQLYSVERNYDIYGTADIIDTGQGRTTYNNDSHLVFLNTLEPLVTDSGIDSDAPDHNIQSVNSWGAKAALFALGSNNLLTQQRLSIEQLFDETNIVDTGVGLISEMRIPRNLIYLGNLYGGNTYESKKRSNYIEIGEYQSITNNIYNCLHVGDTFVSNFRFTKLVKTNTEIYSETEQQITEIVEFKVETTVDLNNRNDYSIQDWNNRFQPSYDEYQQYNRVYSQESNLIIRKDIDYKFRKVNSFDTNIISTKVKVPGELIDSWTDLQPNNIMTLDGRFGPINSLHSFKDEIYTLQDSAIAFISILPRIQVSGSDGLAVELGTGNVLQEYKYISTESGTKNKWSVVNSPSAFYFYDTSNKSINIFKQGLGGLSDAKGLHTYFTNNTFDPSLLKDNPFIERGISSGFDYINNDVFFTFLQSKIDQVRNDNYRDDYFTISYNEGSQSFTSFYDYKPSMYISRGNNLLTTNPDNNKLYKQYNGNYNTFYDVVYPSYITLMLNPEPDSDTIFDNIEYKSEVYLNNIDQPNITLSKYQLYNEYQNSGLLPLTPGRQYNLRRRFRDWNAILPREQGTRNRIRNPWCYLKLQFDNTENYKLILHDLILSYTV